MKTTVKIDNRDVAANLTILKVRRPNSEVISLRVIDLGSQVDVVQGDGDPYAWPPVDGPEVIVEATRFYRTEGASFTGWVARSVLSHDTCTDPIPTKPEALAALFKMAADELKGEIVA